MFACDVCGTTTAPGTPLRRVPAGYRVKRYPRRSDAQVARIANKKKPVIKDDPGGVGFEWKGMLRSCPSCHAKYEADLKEDLESKVEERLEELVAAK